jgi:hypothetical protein
VLKPFWGGGRGEFRGISYGKVAPTLSGERQTIENADKFTF